MLLQEALMSRLKIRQNYETPTTKIVAAKAYEKSRKGQLALLGKLPDFTIDDTKTKLAFLHQTTLGPPCEDTIQRNLSRIMQSDIEK
mmetsp:Transcript_9551/g.10705  ORF Transcript_9551/g.10705 Transcript_9551/m.10705 type:complete len:87 (+) Transcript_9551:69-329(+)